MFNDNFDKKLLPTLEIKLFFRDGQNDDEKLFRNDYTYLKAVKSFYKIHTTPRTWFDAKHDCLKEGARLYYPESDEESLVVMSFRNGTEPDIESMFVGISDLVSQGVFETIDGKSVSEVYNAWSAGEPNDDIGKQDCVQQDKKGELNDHQCTDKFAFICKKSLQSLEQNHTSSTDEHKEFFREDYTYIQAVESFYKIHGVAQNWTGANQVCAAEGSTLYYPVNEDEQNVVMSFRNRTHPGLKWLYLGFTDIKTEGEFETIDGKLISEAYTDWKADEPNDKHGDEDCVEQDSIGKMNDCSCINIFPFICKKISQRAKEKKNKKNYGCNIDYSLNQESNKCYKLHTTPLKWTGAYAVCRAEQSHLAVINNPSEAEYLAKLVETASNQRIGGYPELNRGIYHLGFRYTFYEGWQTVRGTPMKVYDNSWWNKRQPIVDERDLCGSMFYNGRLNSINCNTKSFFICEHEVGSSTVTEENFQ